MVKIIAAALHLIALGLGLSSVLTRGSAIREKPTQSSLRRAFTADIVWGVAAFLWISTGLWRLLGGLEKGVAFYMKNSLFHAKLTSLFVILALEVMPMIVLLRWRQALQKGEDPAAIVDPLKAKRIAIISHVQALLVVVMVFCAVAMARGYGVIAR